MFSSTSSSSSFFIYFLFVCIILQQQVHISFGFIFPKSFTSTTTSTSNITPNFYCNNHHNIDSSNCMTTTVADNRIVSSSSINNNNNNNNNNIFKQNQKQRQYSIVSSNKSRRNQLLNYASYTTGGSVTSSSSSSTKTKMAATATATATAATTAATTTTVVDSKSKSKSKSKGKSTTAPIVEKYEFQAEVTRVMDIIINSLYSNRDVFLREIVSNAADACDKKRHHLLTMKGENNNINNNNDINNDNDDNKLKIRITSNKKSRTLTIEDNGIGMSKEELMNNLGKIAQSGTKKFVEELMIKNKNKNKNNENQMINQIGQFGVGFYSGFLAADKMTVITKRYHNDINDDDHKIYKWESEKGSSYTISEMDVNKNKNTDDDDDIYKFSIKNSNSGTKIILHLKEDAEEYLDQNKLNQILTKYSEFVNFDIELHMEKTKYEKVIDEKAAKLEKNNDNNNDNDNDNDNEKVVVPQEPIMKTIATKSMEWELINKQKPIWLRDPSQEKINKTDYIDFYKNTFKLFDVPLNYTHFKLEGQIEFKALLFLPSVVPFELKRDMFDASSSSIRLYVKRVFISDKFEQLLPRWCKFIRGVVDSEDLPLNVGREILQKSKILKIINKRLVKKVIEMFNTVAQDSKTYKEVWKNFGKYLKVGMIEDPDYRQELGELSRWHTTRSGEDIVSLSEYVDHMKSKNSTQNTIFYVCGESREQASRIPALEKLKKMDYEVILVTDPIDEMALQNLASYRDIKIIDAAKEKIDIGMEDNEEMKKNNKEIEHKTTELRSWYKKVLDGQVLRVDISTRLTDSPAAIVQSAYGMSPNMQKYYKAQATAEMNQLVANRYNQAVLELNPTHSIIETLFKKYKENPDADDTQNLAKLIYEVAAMGAGYSVKDPLSFGKRITDMMISKIGVEEANTITDVIDSSKSH